MLPIKLIATEMRQLQLEKIKCQFDNCKLKKE